ncbi:hypothetical protein [Niameybacter massiliensis]|uniref:hypothetical protein n=1 Tax=Niameybacter massiliensis TaxID=1658108 RepID=UPI0006B590CB|nr:hypothetical protein [Niameybacter massiliensis]
MKKMMKKLAAVGLVVMSVGATPVMAAPVQATSVTNQQNVGMQGITPNITTVRYSDMVKGDGAVHIEFKLNGVKLTTTDPYKFSDAVTHNYDVSVSEGVHYNKELFSMNVNWSNPGIAYNGDWVINIDGSVFSDGADRTITIKVINDLAHVGTPSITTNVDKGVTVQQLTQGFDLVMNINNARFNTTCFGNYIRVSMMNSCGMYIYPVAYCDSLKPNQVKMRVQAMNGVESWRTHFEFKIEGNATNSSVPINVRIPIIR